MDFKYKGKPIVAKSKVEAIKKILARVISPYRGMRGKTAEQLLSEEKKYDGETHFPLNEGDDDTICPYCGKESSGPYSSEVENGDMCYRYTCSKCKGNWRAFYNLEPSEIWIEKK